MIGFVTFDVMLATWFITIYDTSLGWDYFCIPATYAYVEDH